MSKVGIEWSAFIYAFTILLKNESVLEAILGLA